MEKFERSSLGVQRITEPILLESVYKPFWRGFAEVPRPRFR